MFVIPREYGRFGVQENQLMRGSAVLLVFSQDLIYLAACSFKLLHYRFRAFLMMVILNLIFNHMHGLILVLLNDLNFPDQASKQLVVFSCHFLLSEIVPFDHVASRGTTTLDIS